MQKSILTYLPLTCLAIFVQHSAHAGSFSLYTESSPAAISNYAAGIAAEAYDASTGWYNPAGLALLHETSVVLGAVGVFPKTSISGTSTYSTPGLPNYVQSFQNVHGERDAAVPSLHFAKPLSDNAAFGLSIVAPYGLSTRWSSQGPVRYEATNSQLVTTLISPELGARISSNFAFGMGVDLEYATVKFDRVLGSPTLGQVVGPFLGLGPNMLDSGSYNEGHSFSTGFHAGGMLLWNEDHTRIGLNYQSSIKHTFYGHSQLKGRLASPELDITDPITILAAQGNTSYWHNGLSSNTLEFPDITTLSGYHDLNDRWAVQGSVVYTGWHSLRTIELHQVAGFAQGIGQIPVNSISTLYYKNTWRAAIGANYLINDQWLLRFGGGYDQTPTRDAYRDVRIADADRWALAIGAHYQTTPTLGFDLGYSHLFATGNVPINKTDIAGAGSTYTVNASAKASADLVGLQLNWTLDKVPEAPMKA